MPKIYRAREGALTAVDTKVQLTTLASRTAPGPLLVPGSAKYLIGARVANVASNESATGGAYLHRIEGPGLKRGTFTFAGGADGGAVATGGSSLIPASYVPINIEVVPGQEVLIFTEALGADQGTYQSEVELIFSDTVGPEGEAKGEITVEGDISAVDTLTRLTAQGSVSAPSRLTPPDATMIKHLAYSVAHDSAADGEVTFHVVLSGDALKGGEQVLLLGAGSFIDVQSGSDAARNNMGVIVLRDLDIEINPNETLDISVEMAGVDVGTANAVITAILA